MNIDTNSALFRIIELNVKRAPVMSMFIERLPLYIADVFIFQLLL